MTDFRQNTLALVAMMLDGPNHADDEQHEKLLAHLEEHYSESQLIGLEEGLNDLVDACFTARRRITCFAARRETLALMDEEQIRLLNPTGTLMGALSMRPQLHIVDVDGGQAA